MGYAAFSTVRERLTDRFQHLMKTDNPSVPVFFDNQRFEQPGFDTDWTYFALLPGLYYRTDLGGGQQTMYRVDGVFNIACMKPQNDGTKGLYELVDSILQGMNDQRFLTGDGALYTNRAVIKNRGLIEGWHTINVQGEFRYDFGVTNIQKRFPDVDLESLLLRAARATYTVEYHPFLGEHSEF